MQHGRHRFRRQGLLLLITLAASVAGLIDAFRATATPESFPLRANEHLFVLSRETVADEGPVFARRIDSEQQRAVSELLGGIPVSPLGRSDLLLKSAAGIEQGVSVLDTDAELTGRLATTASVEGMSLADCRESTVLLTVGTMDRLAVKIGDRIELGDARSRIAGAVDAKRLAGLPGGNGTSVVRCTERLTDKADYLLAFLPTTTSAASLVSQLASLSDQSPGFTMRWAAQDIADNVDAEARRQAGWLLGARMIVLTLSTGAIVILAILRALLGLADVHVRLALGESWRHRLRRIAFASVKLALLAGPAAAALVLGIVFAWSAYQPVLSGLRAGWLDAVRACLIHATLFAAIGGTTAWLVEQTHSSLLSRLRGGKTGPTRRPLAVASFVVAALCAAIAVPTSFLVHEFARLSHAPQGYQTEGLYAIELHQLEPSRYSQDEAWQQLNAMLNDLKAASGVADIGAMGSAPWSYAGEASVKSGQEHMILNVSASPGTMGILRPDRRQGQDFSVSARVGNEVLVQGLDPTRRQQFVPQGASIVGELSGIRFSPLDGDDRQAIVSPMQGNLPPIFSLVFRPQRGMADVRAIEQRLQAFRDRFVVAPAQSVQQIIDGRLQGIRLGTMTALAAAGSSILLLLFVMLTTLRLHFVSQAREIAIRLCVGASAPLLARRLLVSGLLVFGSGWLLGSAAGLEVWNLLIASLQDYRLSQPWSGLWLLPPALLLVGTCIASDAWMRARQLDLRAALAA